MGTVGSHAKNGLYSYRIPFSFFSPTSLEQYSGGALVRIGTINMCLNCVLLLACVPLIRSSSFFCAPSLFPFFRFFSLFLFSPYFSSSSILLIFLCHPLPFCLFSLLVSFNSLFKLALRHVRGVRLSRMLGRSHAGYPKAGWAEVSRDP